MKFLKAIGLLGLILAGNAQIVHEDQIKLAFNVYDENRDGKIDVK